MDKNRNTAILAVDLTIIFYGPSYNILLNRHIINIINLRIFNNISWIKSEVIIFCVDSKCISDSSVVTRWWYY